MPVCWSSAKMRFVRLHVGSGSRVPLMPSGRSFLVATGYAIVGQRKQLPTKRSTTPKPTTKLYIWRGVTGKSYWRGAPNGDLIQFLSLQSITHRILLSNRMLRSTVSQLKQRKKYGEKSREKQLTTAPYRLLTIAPYRVSTRRKCC